MTSFSTYLDAGAVRLPHLLLGCAFFLVGCVQVGPKELPFGESKNRLRGIVAEQPATRPQQPCPAPTVPPPIPEVAHIAIEPGKSVEADAGGEALLRAYIAQREWALHGGRL